MTEALALTPPSALSPPPPPSPPPSPPAADIDVLTSDCLRVVLEHCHPSTLRSTSSVSHTMGKESRAAMCSPTWRTRHLADVQLEAWLCGAYVPRKISEARVSPPCTGLGSMAVDVRGEWIVAAGQSMSATVWRITSLGPCQHVHTLAHDSAVTCSALQLQPGGCLLATACRSGFLRLWDLPSGKLTQTIDAHSDEDTPTDVFGLVWTGVNTLLSAGVDGTLQQWSTVGKAECVLARLDANACAALAYDGALGLVASPQRDYSVALLDEGTLACRRRLLGHSRPILTVAIGDESVACAGMGGSIRVWNATTGQCTCTFEYKSAGTFAVRLIGNELLLSGGCGETCVRVWGLRRGKLIARLNRPNGGAGSVCALAAHRSELGAFVLSGDNATNAPQLWEAVC